MSQSDEQAALEARCLRCDGTGLICDECGESENTCKCGYDTQEFSDCEDCHGTDVPVVESLAALILRQRREAVEAAMPENVRQAELLCAEAVEAARPRIERAARIKTLQEDRERLRQAYRDINNLIAELEAHQSNTGEFLEDEDAAVVDEIKQRAAINAAYTGIGELMPDEPKPFTKEEIAEYVSTLPGIAYPMHNGIRCLLATLDARDQEISALRASLDQVDDVLVVNFVGPRKDGDYRRALSDLVALNIQIENDPRVSLTAKVRQDELEALRADRDRLDELQRLVLDGADIVRDDERLIVFIQKDDPATCGPLYVYRGDGENALRDAVDAAQKGEREWKLNRTK